MWRKHQSVYQDHMKYFRNDIVKPFKVKILCYTMRVRDMNELAKYLPPPLRKGESAMADNWEFRNEEVTAGDLRLAIRGGLHKSTRDELDYHPEDYCSLTYEDWCELMSTIEVKYERKREACQIKKISSTRAASLSNSDESVRIPRRKKAKTGVSNYHNIPRRAHDRHHVTHRYCVL